jgi:5-deoxy-5-amino-3-dehydroquinate synthase
VDILPILIDGPDDEQCRELAAALASALDRSAGVSADRVDGRWVAAAVDLPDGVDASPVERLSVHAASGVDDLVHQLHRTEVVDVGGGRTYPVIVGPGARHRLSQFLPAATKRVAIVTQPSVQVTVDPGVDHRVFTVEDGERAKRLDVVADLASSFAQWGMTRNDVVVAIGGGVVTDLGGFVASTYHRGIPVIHIATTLLGQIDAAIGGKCGVNLPEGKNLLGSFWQPSAVLCDTDTLTTLPTREYRSGLGELAKYHFLGGGDLDALPIVDRVAACVRIKADVVASDEREGGRRAILNYGHTLAHALEAAGTYEIRHGEAVAIGLVYAAEVAHRLGRISADVVAEHRRVVEHYGHPVTVPAGTDAEKILALFAKDKKALDGVTFVLDGPDGVEPVRVDDSRLLIDALEAMR